MKPSITINCEVSKLEKRLMELIKTTKQKEEIIVHEGRKLKVVEVLEKGKSQI